MIVLPRLSLLDVLLANAFRSDIRTGPGERTVFTLHKGIGRSRYTGALLRKLRAERGVGRPPKKENLFA